MWFINYAALDPTSVSVEDLDLHGAGMLPADVQQFAHLWLAHSRSIDINHDGIGRPIFVVESFFNGPDIASPAWPINSHATHLDVSHSEEAFNGLRDGSLNAVSLDAYTFNRVVRLPAAEAKSFLGMGSTLNEAPDTLSGWALELAQRGYPGVLDVVQVGSGLYVAQRSHGMPLAISFKNGQIEASSGGGAWSNIAAALCESGTMVGTTVPEASKRALETGDYSVISGSVGANNQPVDFAPWDPAEVDQMMRNEGLMVGIPLVDQIEGEKRKALEHEMFAALLEETVGVEPSQDAQSMVLQGLSLRSYPHGLLPHHTFRGDGMMVSKEAVLKGLSMLHLLPPLQQPTARAHLTKHLREIASGDPDLPGTLGAPSSSIRQGGNGIFIGEDISMGAE